jgi:alkylation response protein AidB-like acyl-CoA dehydrogenase
LVLEPYLATVVLGGTALRLAGNAAQQAAILPQIVAGATILDFAHGERQARYDLSHVLTTAKPRGAGWVIDGAKSVVVNGDSADWLILSARVSGERDDPDGIGLFVLGRQSRWRGAPRLSDARRHARGRHLVKPCRGGRRRCGR